MPYIGSSAIGKPFTWTNLREVCNEINHFRQRYPGEPFIFDACNKFLYAMELAYQPYPCECGSDIWDMCHAIPAKVHMITIEPIFD